MDNTVAYDEAVTPNSQNPLVTTYMNLPPAPQVLDDVWTSLLITLYLLLYARKISNSNVDYPYLTI